jgi:hypothetical protein
MERGENMKTDKYGIEIKVGDWVQLIFMTGMEFSGEHSGKIFTVKEIKTKFLFLSKSPVVKAYPKNVMRVQPLTNQPSDFDNNYMGKKYVDVATSKQQLDFKLKELKERLANATNDYSKKILQSDIDWEWTKYNKREQKQEERI